MGSYMQCTAILNVHAVHVVFKIQAKSVCSDVNRNKWDALVWNFTTSVRLLFCRMQMKALYLIT